MTTRVSPPADGKHPSITVNGRSYSCAAASTIDVPDHDAGRMVANGWVSHGLVGATSTRPAKPTKGQTFFDSTLGYTIRFDGKNWINPSSGAVV